MNFDETKRRWEKLARTDAEFYILTDEKPEEFFASGIRDAERILEFSAPFLADRSAAIEMGCGVGRLTIPMSAHFGRITAVDIAPTMLVKLAENCASRGVVNVRPKEARSAWDDHPASFAYSRIVFQHIQSWDIIREYFERIAGALTPGGAFYVQMDTRPAGIQYKVRNSLPDFLLPRTWRRGVRRIRRTREEIIVLGKSVGLSVADERGAGTLDHEFVFVRR